MWYNRICQILINQGLRPCTGVDPCVFVNSAGDVIMALYVDYIGIWGEGGKIKIPSDTLKSILNVRCLSDSRFLAIHVNRLRDSSVELDQCY